MKTRFGYIRIFVDTRAFPTRWPVNTALFLLTLVFVRGILALSMSALSEGGDDVSLVTCDDRGYPLGSIPSGYFGARAVLGADPRRVGDGKVAARNLDRGKRNTR